MNTVKNELNLVPPSCGSNNVGCGVDNCRVSKTITILFI